MPWVIGAVVAYVGWKVWETTQGQGVLLGAGAVTGAKVPEPIPVYNYPANVVL